MDDAGRRWGRKSAIVMLATLVLQLALPLLVVAAVLAMMAPKGDDNRSILIIVTLMFLRGVIPTIGMITLMVMGLRRASTIGEAWLVKTLFVLGCLSSIPFYMSLIVPNPLERMYGLTTIFVRGFCLSGMPMLIVLCLALRRRQAWSAKARTTAIVISAICGLTMLPAAIGGILLVMPMVGGAAATLLQIGSIGLSYPGSMSDAIRCGLRLLVAFALWWSMLIDDDLSSSSRTAKPGVLAVVAAMALVATWQVTYFRSTLISAVRASQDDMMSRQGVPFHP